MLQDATGRPCMQGLYDTVVLVKCSNNVKRNQRNNIRPPMLG